MVTEEFSVDHAYDQILFQELLTCWFDDAHFIFCVDQNLLITQFVSGETTTHGPGFILNNSQVYSSASSIESAAWFAISGSCIIALVVETDLIPSNPVMLEIEGQPYYAHVASIHRYVWCSGTYSLGIS